ncbi:MAG: ABC1 kinase family protein [Anaerolineae bacterium]
MPHSSLPQRTVQRARYRRVVRYFAGVFLHFILWEILLRHLLGRKVVERSFASRWQRVARRYRTLATELGGVLIKLGQFLSVRVDILPAVVTSELAGLQDEVSAESLADIQAVIEAEYGQPLYHIFHWFSPEPEAAASLAQVHRAQLLTQHEVVVKVQRPQIEAIVETDLQAIHTATRWLKRYRPIRRRVDLDRLYDEFSRTTRKELDFIAESHHAERFASDFAGDSGIRIPQVYRELSTRRVLIMENVASIKITDFEAMAHAGIDRKEVAHRLFDTYLKQVFIHNFVHADPHPGNLFVEPLPPVSNGSRPFRLVFVDFGMVAIIPERVRRHLRDYLLGFAMRDAGRMVRAYQGAGVLLPGADLARLEQVEAELLERYAGLTLRQVQQQAMGEWQSLAQEYRDILYEMPFQLPTDLLFVGRAIAILFGMATTLDPDFDPWQAIEPFARQMAAEEVKHGWRELLDELEKTIRLIFSLPVRVDRLLDQAAVGELVVRASWSPDAMRTLHRIETAMNRLTAMILFATLSLAAVALYGMQGAGAVPYVLSALALLVLLISLIRR